MTCYSEGVPGVQTIGGSIPQTVDGWKLRASPKLGTTPRPSSRRKASEPVFRTTSPALATGTNTGVHVDRRLGTHTCTCVHTRAHRHTCTHRHAHTRHVRTCLLTDTYIHGHVCTHDPQVTCIYTETHAYTNINHNTYVQMCKRTQAYTHVYAQAYTCTCTHRCIHAHRHACAQPSQ